MYIAEERLGRGNHLTPSNYLARTRYNSALRRRSSGAQARHGDGGGASCARDTTTLARRGGGGGGGNTMYAHYTRRAHRRLSIRSLVHTTGAQDCQFSF